MSIGYKNRRVDVYHGYVNHGYYKSILLFFWTSLREADKCWENP